MQRALVTSGLPNFMEPKAFTMKTTILLIAAFFAFTLPATAQELQEKADRQPPVVTEQQVAKDEQLAKKEREKNEKQRTKQLDRQTREQQRQVTSATTDTPSIKTSKRPGGQ